MTKAEIAPCPYCGSTVRFRDESDNETEAWFVHCPMCGLECGGLHSRDEITAFWNVFAKCKKRKWTKATNRVREILGVNTEPLNEEPKEG